MEYPNNIYKTRNSKVTNSLFKSEKKIFGELKGRELRNREIKF